MALHVIERDELLRLLRRDHRELEMALIELTSPDLPRPQRATILDGIRLGLLSHGAAEDLVVYGAVEKIPTTSEIRRLVEQARAAHDELERMLAHLLSTPMSPTELGDYVRLMRRRAETHAAREENELIPLLRASLSRDAYRGLARAYTAERFRQLSMLEPSAPKAIFFEARLAT